MSQVVLALFYVVFPVFVIWLAGRSKMADKLGPVVICYIAGIVVGNIGILPDSAPKIQDICTSVTIPIALPLIFFSINVKRWSRLAGRALLAFMLQTVAIIIVSSAGYFIFRAAIGDETWKLAGMFVGVYTGGTINLAAIATALKTDASLYIAAHTSDVVISSLYLFFLMTVGQRVLGFILPRFVPKNDEKAQDEVDDYNSFKGMFTPGTPLPLLGALGLSILIFGIGGSLTLVLSPEAGTVAAILTITTLGILCSFLPVVRNIKMTYQLGQYFILIFCLVVGSMANLAKLADAAPAVLMYVSFAIAGSFIVHMLLAAIFRIDTDTVILTSVAGICSPPFVPVVASAIKNRELVIPGVITGIIGWVVGTYLGIAVAFALRNYFGG